MATVPANATFFEKANLLRVALNSYTMAVEEVSKPGGGAKAGWATLLTNAKAALDAAHTAFAAAVAAEVPAPAWPGPVISPAIGYGSMTGAAGVAVAPNP
jgi:hypothetical protein